MLFNKNKAQAAVEFAFVAPIFILILFVIIEFGHAITIRNTISDAARSALMLSINRYNNLAGTQAAKIAQMETNIQTDVINYLANNNIPNPANVTVQLSIDTNGVAAVKVVYMYRMIMPLIPGVLELPLQSSQIINTALLRQNNFNSPLTTANLSNLFPASGTIITQRINGYDIRRTTGILVTVGYWNGVNITGGRAKLFSWIGEDLLPANVVFNINTGTVFAKSPYYYNHSAAAVDQWFDSRIPYAWVLSALGITNVLFTHYNATVDVDGTQQGARINDCSGTNANYRTATPFADECPMVLGQGTNPSTWIRRWYKINPRDWSDTDLNNFNSSFGLRWCESLAGTGSCGNISSSLVNTHTIHELALKGLSRQGWKYSAFDFIYRLSGNKEFVINTASPQTDDISAQLPYPIFSPNYNAPDGNYYINLNQFRNPIYYMSGINPISETVLSNSNGPFFSIYRFDIPATYGVFDTASTVTKDLTDVYIDSDADGIADFWDDNPDYFDVNANGQLDGLDNTVTFEAGDETVLNTAGVDYATTSYPVPGVSILASTPRNIGGTFRNSKKTNAALMSYIPEMYIANFRVFNGKLYMPCDADSDGTVDDLCRTFPIWSTLVQKSNYIHGTVAGATINLDRSLDVVHLENNVFNAANRITRTPPVITW